MQKPSSKTVRRARHADAGQFVLGRRRFEQISAVEGLRLTADMRSMLDRFEEEGLSAVERRVAIIKRFAPTR